MKTKTVLICAAILMFGSCVKIEHPLDEPKKVEVRFNVNSDIVEDEFRAAILDANANSENVKYLLYENGALIEEGNHTLDETLVLNMLPGDYTIKFYNIEVFPENGVLYLDLVNSTYMNHVYAGELSFTVGSTAITNNVILTRLVSAVRFIKDSSPSTGNLTINSATIESSKEISLFNLNLGAAAVWDTDVNGWNYVFPGEEISVVVNITHNPSGNLYSLTRSFYIERNKKYTVIIKRNNLDQGTTNGGFTLDVDYDWAGDEDIV